MLGIDIHSKEYWRAFQRSWPNATRENTELIGQPSGEYNCIAWAMDDTHRWWDTDCIRNRFGSPCYWPSSVQPIWNLNTFIEMFSKEGGFHLIEDDFNPLPCCDYLAIYGDPNEPEDEYYSFTHVAILRHGSRWWSSKCGAEALVSHATPRVLEGGDCRPFGSGGYGKVRAYMVRRVSK